LKIPGEGGRDVSYRLITIYPEDFLFRFYGLRNIITVPLYNFDSF